MKFHGFLIRASFLLLPVYSSSSQLLWEKSLQCFILIFLPQSNNRQWIEPLGKLSYFLGFWFLFGSRVEGCAMLVCDKKAVQESYGHGHDQEMTRELYKLRHQENWATIWMDGLRITTQALHIPVLPHHMLEYNHTDKCRQTLSRWPQNWKYWKHPHRLTQASPCPSTVWQHQYNTAPELMHLAKDLVPWIPPHTNTAGLHLDPTACFHRSLGLPQLCGHRPKFSAS